MIRLASTQMLQHLASDAAVFKLSRVVEDLSYLVSLSKMLMYIIKLFRVNCNFLYLIVPFVFEKFKHLDICSYIYAMGI